MSVGILTNGHTHHWSYQHQAMNNGIAYINSCPSRRNSNCALFSRHELTIDTGKNRLRNHHNQYTMSIHEGVIEALSPTHFTLFQGRRSTATDIDTLVNEAAKLAASVKITLFPHGLRHGHLSCILSNKAYGVIIGDPNYAWDEEPDADVPAYDPDITAGMAVIMRTQ